MSDRNGGSSSGRQELKQASSLPAPMASTRSAWSGSSSLGALASSYGSKTSTHPINEWCGPGCVSFHDLALSPTANWQCFLIWKGIAGTCSALTRGLPRDEIRIKPPAARPRARRFAHKLWRLTLPMRRAGRRARRAPPSPPAEFAAPAKLASKRRIARAPRRSTRLPARAESRFDPLACEPAARRQERAWRPAPRRARNKNPRMFSAHLQKRPVAKFPANAPAATAGLLRARCAATVRDAWARPPPVRVRSAPPRTERSCRRPIRLPFRSSIRNDRT
jgi:hypothetical protein